MQLPRAVLILSLVVLALASLAPSLAPAQQSLRASIDPEAWEYAELRLAGNDAVIITRGDAQFLEGPTDQEARKFIKLDNDSLRVTQSIRVRHLTRVGSQGWELVTVLPGATDVFLLKRRYDVRAQAPSP